MTKLIAIACLVAALGCKSKPNQTGAATGSAAQPAAVGSASSDVAPVAVSDTPLSRAQEGVVAARSRAGGLVKPGTAAEAGTLIGDVIDQLARTLPAAAREGFDPAAIVARVGSDRVALFKWVRDHTALVPYRGSLRGAVGVLMDRTGNSLDRALLLAELLAKTGATVRLAHATLPPDQVATLARSWSTRKPPAPATWNAPAESLQPFAKLLKVERSALAEQAAKERGAWNALADLARARIAEQTRALAALAPAAPPPAAPDASAFADHWWVQVETGEAWSELDPALPDAEPGATLAAEAETVSLEDAKHEAHSHTLTLRLIAEVWKGTERNEVALVEHTLAPRDFFGQKIEIKNVAIDMPTEEVLHASPDRGAAVRAAVAAQTEWVTMIVVGGVAVPGSSVTDSGEVWNMSGPDANTLRLGRIVSGATKRGVGGATGMLDSLPGSAAGDDPALGQPPVASQTGFTAEWIELEIRSPGSAPRVVRRPVFDLFGDRAAARPIALSSAARLDRGMALMSDVEVLPTFARIPPGFVADRVVKALVKNRAVLVESVRARSGAAPSGLRDRLGSIVPLPGALYALASTRFAWSGVASQVYLDRLDVLLHRRAYHATPKGELGMSEVLDFASNGVGVWPSAGDARAIRLRQGIADTVAEAVIQVACTGRGCRRDNTSDHFAATAGKGWTRLEAGAGVDAQQVALRVRQAMQADLAAGYAVVLPSSTGGARTWWRIDPTTGETLGMGELGGTAFAEYVEVAFNVVAGAAACLAVMFKPHPTGADWLLCAVGVGLAIGGGAAAIAAERAEVAAWEAVSAATNADGMVAAELVEFARNAGGVMEALSTAAGIIESLIAIGVSAGSAAGAQ